MNFRPGRCLTIGKYYYILYWESLTKKGDFIMNKLIKLLVLLFLSAMVLVACDEASIEKVDSDGNSSEATKEEQPKEETKEETKPETQQLKIGETVDFDGLKITLNSARIEPGGEFDEPQEEQFVVVNLTAENTTGEEQVVSSIMNIELKDREGYTYNTTILMEGTKGQFDGSIVAGDSLRGEIPFDVPVADQYELHFSDPFKSGKAIWVLPANELEQP